MQTEFNLEEIEDRENRLLQPRFSLECKLSTSTETHNFLRSLKESVIQSNKLGLNRISRNYHLNLRSMPIWKYIESCDRLGNVWKGLFLPVILSRCARFRLRDQKRSTLWGFGSREVAKSSNENLKTRVLSYSAGRKKCIQGSQIEGREIPAVLLSQKPQGLEVVSVTNVVCLSFSVQQCALSTFLSFHASSTRVYL